MRVLESEQSSLLAGRVVSLPWASVFFPTDCLFLGLAAWIQVQTSPSIFGELGGKAVYQQLNLSKYGREPGSPTWLRLEGSSDLEFSRVETTQIHPQPRPMGLSWAQKEEADTEKPEEAFRWGALGDMGA